MVQNKPGSQIQRFRRGAKTLSERQLNQLVDSANNLNSGAAAPGQPIPRGKAGGSAILILTLVSHEDEYLVCEDAASATFYVAKPFELRTSTYDGETISGITYTTVSESERTAADAASPPNEETQFITPSYVVGAEIFAAKITGGTGVVTEASPPEAIEYLEVNQGRAWAWDETA